MLVEQLQPRIKSVADLYENHPYPYFGRWAGFFQRIRWEERQTLNYKALFAAAWGSAEGAVSRQRILVAGCGTLEPLVAALANPQAEVVGVDLSARSLAILKHQATLRGLRGRIHLVQADIQNLPQTLGLFDLVIATGLIHHLPDPRLGLERLIAQSRERAPFRFMIYSRWGRFLLYSAKIGRAHV